jgi:chitin synthase
MQEDEVKQCYGTDNLCHSFTKHVTFHDLVRPLTHTERDQLKINDLSWDCFLYETNSQGQTTYPRDITMPLTLAIKHENKGKIDSHQWFFKGFTNYINPEFTQIFDAGTIPLKKSMSYILLEMRARPQIGGAAGEIEVLIPDRKESATPFSFLETCLMEAQYVEYKLSHYLDKAFESVFGYISVLPGAFSTYRWKAIKGDPLREFLKGLS